MTKNAILNRKGTKSYILKKAEQIRPGWKVTCVSSTALDQIEFKIKNMIDDMIHRHPSIGKTFKDII